MDKGSRERRKRLRNNTCLKETPMRQEWEQKKVTRGAKRPEDKCREKKG